jgi:hypothetical protein
MDRTKIAALTLSALVAWNGSDFVKIVSNPVALTTDVTGVLPAANGGTGLSSPSTAGNVLTSNGTAWVSSAPAGGGVTAGKSISFAMIFGF